MGGQKDGGVFDQFSGAAITPRAVVRAVKQGLVLFREYKATLLAGKHQQQIDDHRVAVSASPEK